MNNIFANGQKTKLIDGSVTTNNAFQMSMDQIIMNNSQLNEKLENIERPATYNDLMMEQKFQNMNLIDMNINKQIIHGHREPGFENYWREQQQNMPQNIQQGGFQQDNINNQFMNNQYMPQMTTMSPQIHPMLLEFNKSLQTTEKPVENKTEEQLNDANAIYKDIIEVMQEKGDERHLNSEFLKFIKRLHEGDIKLNEKTNDIDVVKDSTFKPTGLTHDEEGDMDEMWNRLEQNLHDIDINPKERALFLDDNPFLYSEGDLDLINLAKTDLESNNLINARYALEAEVQKTPENSEAWLMLGKMHTENDRDDLAIDCFQQAVKVDPFNADALLALGISCTNEFDEFEAMVHLKNWIKLHHEYHEYYDESNMLLNHDLIRKEMDIDREDEELQTKWQRVDVLKLNFYKEMLGMMEGIAMRHPKDSDLWTALGIAHFIPHDNERAIECFREAVKINPKDYSAWNKLGAILAHSGMHEEAIHTYKKALDLKPNFARCWANLGIALLSINQYEPSLEAFLKALQIYQDIPDVWNYVNSSLFYMKRPDLAEYSYSRNLDGLLKNLNTKPQII
jgi:Flp pilus assembly protein TadD